MRTAEPPPRYYLLSDLTRIQAALELLDWRTPLSTEQRELVLAGLGAVYQLAEGIREALVVDGQSPEAGEGAVRVIA